MKASLSGLDAVFSPRSIAVIGASTRKESVGQSIFSNLLMNRYNGILYPVNPKATSILGVRCFSSILDVPDSVDLAVIVVPSKVVANVLEECGKKGVRAAVIISAGFREIGAEGVELEEYVKAVAGKNSIRIVGPNCFGVINTHPEVSMNATFSAAIPRDGNIAFVSQSGALCAAVLDYARGRNIGFSKFVSMGNKCDVTENDLLLAFGEDPRTKVILLYLEDLARGREFVEIARDLTLKKPILAIKSGRTVPGAKAASSHTGALTSSDEMVDTIYDSVFNQCGVLRVETMEELFDYAIAFSKQPLPLSDRVVIITNAGGPAVLATDTCVRHGLTLATLEPATINKLKERLPPAAGINNPVDVLGDALADRYEAALQIALADKNADAAITILTPLAYTDVREIARSVARVAAESGKPVVASFMGLVDITEGARILEEHGIPNYLFPEAAARALAQMYKYVTWVGRPKTQEKRFKVDASKALDVIRRARSEGRAYLPEVEAMEVLRCFGFPLPKSILARSLDESIRAAENIGYPVAMKIASPDIVHKMDVGGVKLSLQGPAEVASAYDQMMRQIKSANPDAAIWGVTIQEMFSGGKETILGIKRDPSFGPIIMFGLGGIYVAAFKDVTFRIAPIVEFSAIRMIHSIRAYRILEGIRGEPASDVEALSECILRLSQMAVEIPDILELDINPLVVFEKEKGCKVLDARILISQRS